MSAVSVEAPAAASPRSRQADARPETRRKEAAIRPPPIPETSTTVKSPTGKPKSVVNPEKAVVTEPPPSSRRSPTGNAGEGDGGDATPMKIIVPAGHRIYGEEAFEALHQKLLGGRTSRGSMALSK